MTATVGRMKVDGGIGTDLATVAQKAKEVEAEKREERNETAKRRAEHTRALKEDDARVKKAVRKTEKPAKEAHSKKLREEAKTSSSSACLSKCLAAQATKLSRYASSRKPTCSIEVKPKGVSDS